ncbi:pyridoxine kinase [bacterium]|nr:pyridoxine kinase [bacterium]
MPLVLVISSYVAGSRVGGGTAPFVLAPLSVDPILVPTTLLGRHPGWGAPGGGPVSPEVMTGMLDAVEANGLFSLVDAVLTGYFTSAAQVEVAARTIDRVRAAPRQGRAHRHAPNRPLIIVDPIMGDTDGGLYVPEEVATALSGLLAPKADIIGGNLFETARLLGRDVGELDRPETIAEAVRIADGDRAWLVSSVATGNRVGAMLVDRERAVIADAPRLPFQIPNGVGDLLKLAFTGALVSGYSREAALARAVGTTVAISERAAAWRAPELPLAACFDLIRTPPDIDLRPIGATP